MTGAGTSVLSAAKALAAVTVAIANRASRAFFIRDSSISKSQKSRGAGRRNNPVRRESSESSFFLANVEVR